MSSLHKHYKRIIFLGIMSFLLVILLVVLIVTYFMTKRITERQLVLSTQSTATAVAMMISEDIDSYRDFVKTKDVNSAYYRKMQRNLAEIKQKSSIKFIYTTNRLDETRTEFILDAEPIGSEFYSAPGDMETENTVTLQVFNTKESALLSPTKSPFGVLLGSSAPILDKNGEIAGVVGVDIDGGTVFYTLRNILAVLLGTCLFLLIVIGFLLLRMCDSFLDPVLKDKLTGAYNKRYSDTLLQQCIERAIESNYDLSALMLDLDYFKKVNDTYGHNFGDVVLAKISSLIQECLRKDDFLIRYGGEEFLVLLFNLSADTAEGVAERIRKNVETCRIYNEKENTVVRVTISIGVASLSQRKISGVELVNNADAALYKAKETRNAVAVSKD